MHHSPSIIDIFVNTNNIAFKMKKQGHRVTGKK